MTETVTKQEWELIEKNRLQEKQKKEKQDQEKAEKLKLEQKQQLAIKTDQEKVNLDLAKPEPQESNEITVEPDMECSVCHAVVTDEMTECPECKEVFD